MKLVAFDLSLASTGYAILADKTVSFGTIKCGKERGMERLEAIRKACADIALYSEQNHEHSRADLVICEALAFAAHDLNHERAGLATLIRHSLWLEHIPYVLAAPTSLKKFVTGSGKAEKSQMMLAVFQHFKHIPANDNEADAIGLLYLGRMLTGELKPETKAQQETLQVIWNSNAEALQQAGFKQIVAKAKKKK